MNLRGKLVNKNYIPRVLDRRIFEDMHDFGAVCIEGPKYCGKLGQGEVFAIVK